MSVLEEICEKKKDHIARKKSTTSLEDLKYHISEMPLPIGFADAMRMKSTPALIAEVKKASPSKGIIRENFNHIEIAKTYEKAGATCLSVLTDEPYFQGHDQYLIDVKKSVSIPVLRKDFIIDEYQVYESRALGADCILLIMAALSDTQARNLYELALELKLDILVEIHDLNELERSLRLDPMMIGVNNRNLKTLEVTLQTSFDLLMNIPAKIYKITESGIFTNADLQRLHTAGYKGFLVGESLMRQENITTAVHELLGTNEKI